MGEKLRRRTSTHRGAVGQLVQRVVLEHQAQAVQGLAALVRQLPHDLLVRHPQAPGVVIVTAQPSGVEADHVDIGSKR